MRIAIVGTSRIGGGYKRIMAFRDFLTSRNHSVDLVQFPGESYATTIWYYYQRAYARYIRGHERRHMVKTADRLEKRIREKKYDVVIGVETPFSYVLTRDLGCLKIFSCETLQADELYFSKKVDLERVRSLREMEQEILMKSDYVVFPWETTENYARKHIWDGKNFLTLKFGCYPQNKTVSYFYPVSIIHLGQLWGYWTNKELLSYLTRTSPYVIHVYGSDKPPRKYHLNYKGFAKSLDIFYNYQFGLETASKGTFRLHSSKIMSYIAYGLPALSPDWMKFSHELKGVLPYNETNFVDIIEKYSDRDQWEKLSKEAYQQALDLDWRITLKPLEKLIEK